MTTLRLFRLYFLLFLLLPITAHSQGTLTPPGPPGPSLRSLSDIDSHLSATDAHIAQAGEQRTPIDATHTPGDADNMFIISQPGSYYLPTTINATSPINGISIRASFVTVDLNGYGLNAPIGSPKKAIEIVGALVGICVRNGTISNWTDNPAVGGGVGAASSEFSKLSFTNNRQVALGTGDDTRVTDCVFTGNGGGVVVGSRCVVSRCVASQNTNGDGIRGGSNCVVVDSTANSNSATGGALSLFGNGFRFATGTSFQRCTAANNNAGFQTGSDSTLSDCTATANVFGISVGARSAVTNCTANMSAAPGAAGDGISAGISAVISNSAASGNALHGIAVGHGSTIFNCTVKDNGGNGILTDDACTISKCSARENHLNGIQVGSACTVEGNTVQSNAIASNANGTRYSGIVANGTGNRIEANHVVNQDASGAGGINVVATNGNNLVIHNSAHANAGGNYIIASGNVVGPSVNASTLSTNNNPSCNYDY